MLLISYNILLYVKPEITNQYFNVLTIRYLLYNFIRNK